MNEYDVVWPLSRRDHRLAADVRPNENLNDARIALVWDYLFHGDRMFELWKEQMSARWPGITYLGPADYGNIHDSDMANGGVEDLLTKLKAQGITGAIVAVGACGSCTPVVARTSAAIESLGTPVVAVFGEAFGPMARIIAAAEGSPQLATALYPGPGLILTDSGSEFRRKVVEEMLPQVVAGLQGRKGEAVASEAGGYGPRDIVFRGDLDDVFDHFTRKGWTDGLPVVPPTVERVDRFIQASGRDPEASLGVLKPERRQATVWSCAVNAVMAGCRPEYMPLLLAIVECAADWRFHLEDAGATPGWDPLICVSGPQVDELDFNAGTGVMRVGRRANTSIARFLRLYMRNVAGLRIPPGQTDQAAIGQSFNVALAESDEIAEASGLEPVRYSLGYGPRDSVAILQGIRSVSPPIYTTGDTPGEHLDGMRDVIVGSAAPTVHRAYRSETQSPVLIISPSVARIMATVGMTRADIAGQLAARCWIPVETVDAYAARSGLEQFSAAQRAEKMGVTVRKQAGTDSVPVFPDASKILLVVAGNPGRNQSRAYYDNGAQGDRVVRKVVAGPGGAFQAN